MSIKKFAENSNRRDTLTAFSEILLFLKSAQPTSLKDVILSLWQWDKQDKINHMVIPPNFQFLTQPN